MALVAFVRGINVGGHRRFKPSTLVEPLRRFDLVNVGAAGTFVARRAKSSHAFVRALAEALPFDADIAVCEADELLRLEPHYAALRLRASPDIIHFVSILSAEPTIRRPAPFDIPATRPWYVRVLATHGRLVLGVYRRQMKTIGYLNEIPTIFGASATTRNWNTISAILRILRSDSVAAE